MAENYFPSSVGIGQGGAQVLQGRTPQLSASGIVRGIEQVGKDIREEQAYQKQIELAKAKEKNERLKSLDETITKIQLPDNVAVAEREVGNMWDRINKGEDYETVFPEIYGNIERLRNADNFYVKNIKNLQDRRYWDEEKEQYYYAGDLSGEYMDGNIADIQALEEGGINAYIGRIYEKFDPLSKNWYDMASTDMTKLAADFLDEKYKQKGEVNAEEVLFDSGRSGIKVSTSLEEEDLLDAEKELLKSERVKMAYLSSIGFPYKHKIEEGDEEYSKFVKELLADAKERIIFKNFTSPKDGKGKGLVEGEDFIYTSKTKKGEYINPLTGEKSPLQSPTGILADIESEMVYMKNPLKIREDVNGEITEVDLVGVYYDEGKYKGVIQIEKPNFTDGADTFDELEVDLSGDNVALLKTQGINLDGINKKTAPKAKPSAKDKEAGNKSWSEDDPL